MSFHFLSGVLRGRWLLDKAFADSQMPLVLRMLSGETVHFDMGGGAKASDEDEKQHLPTLVTGTGAAAQVYNARVYSDVSSLPENSVIVYTLAGPMVKRGGMCSYGMVDHADALNRFGNAPNVAGIILSIDSPGGQADGTAMLADVIKAVADNKPVLAMIDDGMAASAAMWIASAADEIYVTQATDQVGSIGVYTTIADFNAHYRDHFKLPVQDVYAPQSTDKNGDYRSAIAGDTTALEEDLSVLADQFINTVAKNRGARVKGDAWKTGKMFYAKDAQKQGLIDGVKSFNEIVNRMNTLISQRKKSSSKSSNNMAFEKVLVASKATEFAVVEGGFMLSEDNLNNVESVLATAETNAGLVATLNTTVNSLNGKITEMTTAAGTAATTISANATRIQELEAQIAALGKGSSGKGTVLKTAGDANTGEQKSEHKFAGDEWADSKLTKCKEKTDYSKLIQP